MGASNMSRGILSGLRGFAVGMLTVGALAGCGGDGTDPADASASCVAAVATVTPTSVPVGGSVEIHGRYYTHGCGDVVENGKQSPIAAMKAVPLILSTGGDSGTEIAKLDASGKLGLIDASVTIPNTVAAGTITLQLGDAEPVGLTVAAN
jgi:hypothetical protein